MQRVRKRHANLSHPIPLQQRVPSDALPLLQDRHRQGCSVAQSETESEGLNFSAAPKGRAQFFHTILQTKVVQLHTSTDLEYRQLCSRGALRVFIGGMDKTTLGQSWNKSS